VLIDVDAGTVKTQFNDLELLPDDMVSLPAINCCSLIWYQPAILKVHYSEGPLCRYARQC